MKALYKSINEKLKNDTARIEFWMVMGFIAVALLFNVFEMIHGNLEVSPGVASANGVQISGNFVGSSLTGVLFNHLIILISYLLLVLYVAPAFENAQERASNTLFVFAFIAICFILQIINFYFTALLALKIMVIFFNRNRQNKENALYYETALLTAWWLFIMVVVAYTLTPVAVRFYAIFDIPAAMLVYLYAVHYILPRVWLKRFRFLKYFGLMFLLVILSTLVMLALSYSVKSSPGQQMDDEMIAIVSGGNFLTQLLIVITLAWNIYKSRNAKKDEEIQTLKTELGKSDANLNFLKSQINPHFLFNALNTLYGTALQENAERTGEGIQKLGDMMRFMLQENTQDKILLSRDIDYLKNYILLQKLRTSTSSVINIETQIEDYAGELMIAPMLLIPFVENAFKHGISLLNPSHIKVTLQVDGNTLYFDVHNSIHIRNESDPEKGQSGIGLDNVKQRLILLYPGKHDLIIRESAKEFFIHLTIQLDNNNI